MSTILVTGATDGLGRALAHELVARGHEVVVHGRSRERAEAVAKEIGGAEIVVADFARLDDVRAVQVQGIDVLVNNADIIAAERRLSEDGIELTFQVNHLAGFLLALQMLPPRTVNVASIGQRRRTSTTSCSSAATRATTPTRGASSPRSCSPSSWPDRRSRSTVAEGVEATAALVERDDVTGRYFDGLVESRADPLAYDAEARRRLWDVSAELTSAPPLAR